MDRLRAAEAVLGRINPEFPDRAAVLAAAEQVGGVIGESLETLPWRLLFPAAELQLRLVGYGPPEATVWRMSRGELEDLCRRMSAFIGLVADVPLAKAA